MKKFSVFEIGVKNSMKRAKAEKMAEKLKESREQKNLFKPKVDDFEFGLAMGVIEELERERREEERAAASACA